MSTNLLTTFDSNPAKTLLASQEGYMKRTVLLAAGKGAVERGTVCYRNANGFWEAAATANLTSNSELAIIEDTTDTGTDADANAVVANAMTGGVAVGENLVFASGMTLTQTAAQALRVNGIHLKAIIGEDGSKQTAAVKPAQQG